MSRKNLILLRGGFGPEQNLSKRFGKFVRDKVSDKHKIIDVNIDSKGHWYHEGLRVLPASKRIHNDGILPCLFSIPYNFLDELEALHMPIVGFTPNSYRKAQDKVLAKKIASQSGIKTPHSLRVTKEEDLEKLSLNIFRSVPLPVIIKPTFLGSSIDTTYVSSFPDLENSVKEAFENYDEILVEQFIDGKEGSVYVINNFRNEDYYAFMPFEVCKNNKICSFDEKCINCNINIPGTFSLNERKMMQEIAKEAHKSIGQKGISKVDFIVHPKLGIYFLEINPMPVFDDLSGAEEVFSATGTNINEVLDHIISLAFE